MINELNKNAIFKRKIKPDVSVRLFVSRYSKAIGVLHNKRHAVCYHTIETKVQ